MYEFGYAKTNGEQGAVLVYISSDADESREAAFLPDGANSPLMLGAQQVGGVVAVEGASPAGLALFGLAAACLLGGALAASLIGNKDDGVNSGGGDGGGGGGRPAKLVIGDIWDMLRSRCRTHRSSRDMHAWIERLAPPTADVPLRAQGADHSTVRRRVVSARHRSVDRRVRRARCSART